MNRSLRYCRVFYTVLLFLITFQGVAEDVWKKSGWTVVSKQQLDGELQYKLKNTAGFDVTVYLKEQPDALQLRRINRLVTLISGWQQLQPAETVMRQTSEGMQVVVVPRTFVYEKVDLAKHMPGGLTFYLEKQLRYAFRMTKDRIAMKLEGVFIDKDEFMLRCLSAVKNPLAYAGKSNFVARMDRLQRELDYMKRRYVALQKAFVVMRRGVLALHNTGFLRGARSVAHKKIARVVALKEKHPDWTVDRIEDQLEKEKIEISSKEIELILALFFNVIE